MSGYRFIIVDDHPLFRGALSQALGDAFANADVLQAGSLDELTDQLANAGVLTSAGGAIRLDQAEFTPDRLASEIAALAGEPAKLTAMAAAAKSVGAIDAADRLADLVLRVGGVIPPAR